MDPTFSDLALTLSLMVGAIWFTIVTIRLQKSLDQIENGDLMLEEIKDSIEIVGQILNRLPELMPQFNMPQTNPFATFIESYFESIVGTKVSKTDDIPRSSEGRFIDGGTTWEEASAKAPSGEADVENNPGP